MPDLSLLLPFLFQGVAFGSVYAITGTSLVVLYRTTGVVNIAFGAVGALSAHVAWTLLGGSLSDFEPRGDGLAVLAYPAMLLVSGLVTLLYGLVFAPQLERRDPMVKALGTVALALFLVGVITQIWDASKARSLHVPNETFRVAGTVVSTTQVAALVLSVLVVVGVSWLLDHTETGTAMRAIANNRQTSALLGVPVRRVEATAWFGSGVLCGLAFLVVVPLFKSLDQATLVWFVIPALAGAIVGRFRSLWITWAASMLIGTTEAVLTPFRDSLQFLSDFRRLTPLVVSVVAILWLSRRRTVVLAGREMS